jgi:hypothetical protein
MANYPTSPKPSYSVVKDINYKTLISNFENGAEQRRNKWSQGKLSFSLVYKILTAAQMTILWDFYIARKGSFESFTYTDVISATAYTVRFSEDSLSFEEFSNCLKTTGLKMIQVL